MSEAKDTPGTNALREKLENADNVLNLLPRNIVAELPKNAKLVDILTLTLKNYDKAMGGVSFTLSSSKTFEVGRDVPVVFALPGEAETEWFYVRGVSLGDGDVRVTINEATLVELAGKTFLAMLFGKQT